MRLAPSTSNSLWNSATGEPDSLSGTSAPPPSRRRDSELARAAPVGHALGVRKAAKHRAVSGDRPEITSHRDRVQSRCCCPIRRFLRRSGRFDRPRTSPSPHEHSPPRTRWAPGPEPTRLAITWEAP